MSSEVKFLSDVSHAIDPKSRNDVMNTNFNRRALEVTKSLKKSIPRSEVVRIIDGDDELKKHSMRSIEMHSKELNEKQA